MADDALGAELLRAMFEQAPDGLLLLGSEGTILGANPAAEALYQTPLTGRRISGLSPPEGRTLELRTVPLSVGAILMVVREATDHERLLQRTEDALRRNEARFRALIEKSSDVVWVTDAGGRTIYVSPSVASLFGYPPEELLGLSPDVLVHPEDRLALRARRSRLREQPGAMDSAELRCVHLDGSIRWIAIQVTNHLDDPDIGGVISNLRDVTAHRRSADAVRASEQRYRRIVESTSDGVWTVDPRGITTFANRRMAALLGCSLDALLGQPVERFMDPADARRHLDRRQKGISEAFELSLRREDGAEVRVEIRANPLFDEEGAYEGALAVVTDITERRRAEAARAHLAAIVSHSDDAILSIDPEWRLTSWNLGAERLFGWSAEEAIGRDIEILSAPGAPRLPLTLDRFEISCAHRDGSRVEVSLTLSPLRDPEGRVVGTSVIARDLRERRRAEAVLRKAETQLRQAQKMEAVGTLAGGVAHDFNNLLSVILGYSEFALSSLDPRDSLAADIGEIRRAGERARDLTRQLLAFSRQQALQPRVIDLNQVLGGMAGMLRRLLRADVELSLLTAQGLGTVHADPTQIEQIVMNLVVNAVDAMPDGGRLTIETGDVEIDDTYAADHLGVAPGPYVLLAVSDTGAGMDSETRARIFEPFFTTKEKGKGTGLGLSTVYGIVQQSGGAIWAYSEPGNGSVFKVYLPRSDRPADEIEPTPAPITLRGTETVLLVEDEEQVRALARTALRRAGYNVLDVQNGGEAFLLCEQYPARIHLLLTDVVMPRMSGRQLADRVGALRPEMRVLYMSGYTDHAIVHHGVVDAGVAFLEKPITPDSLLRKVRELLDAPPGAPGTPRPAPPRG